VNLGIIPGAEGTQRLPRLAGVAKALDMCVTGKPIPAAEALRAGIIDAIAGDDLRVGRRVRGASPATCVVRAIAAIAWRRAHQRAAVRGCPAGREVQHQTAPLKAIEAIEAATLLP
jgi:3-hydroxyacyl-CoA dehydrogenase